MSGWGWGWKPYVSVAQRRRNAQRELEKSRKKGDIISPVILTGRAIAATFWGKAWCENLERYSDFANRLPRGRSYVRNGSVIDLQIAPGAVRASVSGSSLYTVTVKVASVSKARWQAICTDCASQIDSLVELLQGKLSKGVMERICRPKTGLFPAPGEIQFNCTCPDWADMCKHVAAVLYGVGARLDNRPELLFRLHAVDQAELIAKAAQGLSPAKPAKGSGSKVLAGGDLEGMFGLDMAEAAIAPPKRKAKAPAANNAAAAANPSGPKAAKKPGRPQTSPR
ncbi:MAG: hypothetical protein FJW31_06310 [Acidobacteria bacterium]|nr:hypothetical protein [Acidobacteriota bacterium]